MRTLGYTGVWAGLIVATALELTIFGLPIAATAIVSSIVVLAALKALLIALFYQHLTHEPKSISIIYVIGLLAGSGLLLALIVSYH